MFLNCRLDNLKYLAAWNRRHFLTGETFQRFQVRKLQLEERERYNFLKSHVTNIKTSTAKTFNEKASIPALVEKKFIKTATWC